MIVFLYFNDEDKTKNITKNSWIKYFGEKSIFILKVHSWIAISIERFVYSFNPFSGVSSEYGNNELFFVYKNFIGNNRSSPFGVYESRRSVGGTDLKRSPISSEIHK